MDRNMPVQSGGLWNSTPVQYSAQTQQLLKDMMQESKLTNLQMRKVSETMKKGSSLPTDLPPTSSARQRSNSAGKPRGPMPKVLNPKNYQSSLRTREQIVATGAYEKPAYRPTGPSGRNQDAEKRRLANRMAFGDECPPDDGRGDVGGSGGRRKGGVRRMTLEAPAPEPTLDRFDELAEEVEDRRRFLDQMEAAGQGAKYRAKIQAEISQLVREMEIIDKKRNEELERMMRAERSGQ
uniref:UPF0193 protein EVG1 homolog n=2 Tax=Macrostomum lignano TaxID=282301 RepID=A0A1I8GL79_9PLAT